MGADPIRPILKRVEDDVGFHLWVHIGRPKSDEDIPTDVQDSPHNVQDNDVCKRPLTRAKAQLLQDKVNLVLNECEHAYTKNCLLPNGSAFLVLRFQEEAMGSLSK